MTMVDELARSKNSRHKLGAVNQCIQSAFEQSDQVFGSIALLADRFDINSAELFF